MRAPLALGLLGCLLAVSLAGCAPRQPDYGYAQQPGIDPSLGVHLTPSGRVIPSAAVGMGGVSVSASPFGGAVGTRLGPIRLSAGF